MATATAKKAPAKKVAAKKAPAKSDISIEKPAAKKAATKKVAASNGHTPVVGAAELYAALADPAERAQFFDLVINMDIVHKLVAERNRIEMGQGELSRIIGVPQPTLSLMEAGKSAPNLHVLQKYARALGMRLELALTR